MAHRNQQTREGDNPSCRLLLPCGMRSLLDFLLTTGSISRIWHAPLHFSGGEFVLLYVPGNIRLVNVGKLLTLIYHFSVRDPFAIAMA